MVFPRTSVVLDRERGGRLLSTPNHAVFYRPNERYRRTLHDERGDVSVFVAYDGPVPDRPAGPLSARGYLLARRLPRLDALAREEAAALLLDEALGGAAEVRHTPAGRRIAEAAKELLLERIDEKLSLRALAADLHVSPFHLTRTFRAHTGYTLTRYLHELRLRAALESIAELPAGRPHAARARPRVLQPGALLRALQPRVRRSAVANAQFHGSARSRRVVEPAP